MAQGFASRSPGARQVTLDDPTTLAVARSDPAFFLSQADGSLLVIDEAQRAPELVLPLKAHVDRDRRPGSFLLTGSADLLEVRGVGDSLAGRAETIELKPLSQGELARRSSPSDFVSWVLSRPAFDIDFPALEPEAVTMGGYPEPVARAASRRRPWFESYVQRLATHDARELTSGGYPDQLEALLSLIAAGGQQELVIARMARALTVAEGTIESYLRLATTMRLVTELPAWGRSLRSRITRRPKLGLNDSGLSAALAGFSSEDAKTLGGREYYGALVEQFVVLELVKQRGWSREPHSLFHYRSLDGLEVDLVIELYGGHLLAVEVKSSSTVSERSWTNLVRFKRAFPDREVTGVCLHAGTFAGRIDGWLNVLPITALWRH